jgi:hypothetical protein
LGFEELSLASEFEDACVEVGAHPGEDGFELFPWRDVVHGGEEEELSFFGEEFSAGGVDEVEAFDFVSEEFEADGEAFVGGPDLDGVAPDAVSAALELGVGALVLHGVEGEEEFSPVDGGAPGECEDALGVGDRGSEAEDAGDAGDDDGVASSEDVAGGGEAERSRSSFREASFSM